MTDETTGLKLLKTIASSEIDETRYIHSLIELAAEKEMLDEQAFKSVQNEQACLLRERILKYCGKHNSSVPEEVAQRLLDGMLFTQGVYLRTLPSPDAALKALTDTPASTLFENGLKITNRKLKTTRSMVLILSSEEAPFKNVTYSDTVKKGLPAFFGSYNGIYFGDDKIISADYPTALPINLKGIEFIEKYTEYLIYEHKFLSCFPRTRIEDTLCAFEKTHTTLIFNACSRILAASLAVMLAGENPASLWVGSGGCEYIDNLLNGKSRNELTSEFSALTDRLFNAVSLTHEGTREYIKRCIPAAADVAYFALSYRGSRSFVAEKGAEYRENTQLSFSGGTPMPDKEYRELLERLMRTEDDSEKSKLILESVKSLTDLEDILTDTEPSAELTFAVLSSLDDAILAVMLSHYPLTDELGVLKTDTELTLSSRLAEYTGALPKERAEGILKLSENLTEDDG